MSPAVGLVSFPPNEQQFEKPYSEETAQTIDREVRNLLNRAYDKTKNLLTEKRELV